MKILITGGSGFIGSHLYRLYPQAYNLDLKHGEDVCDVLPDFPFTHIFHLAASRSVPDGEKDPLSYIKNNCWGTCNLMRTYPNARILNISSSSVNEVKSF